MPTDIFIDTRLGVVFTRATGSFGWAEAVGHLNLLRCHPDFQPRFNQLSDFRQIGPVTLAPGEIKLLAERTIFSGHSRRAFVVSGNLEFGLGRVYGTHRDLAGESGVAIFRAMEDALSWLSLTPEQQPSMFTANNASATESTRGTST